MCARLENARGDSTAHNTPDTCVCSHVSKAQHLRGTRQVCSLDFERLVRRGGYDAVLFDALSSTRPFSKGGGMASILLQVFQVFRRFSDSCAGVSEVDGERGSVCSEEPDGCGEN